MQRTNQLSCETIHVLGSRSHMPSNDPTWQQRAAQLLQVQVPDQCNPKSTSIQPIMGQQSHPHVNFPPYTTTRTDTARNLRHACESEPSVVLLKALRTTTILKALQLLYGFHFQVLSF